jgi:CRP/FNR family cyclic AMP-dependent transcriptional regulator
MAAHEILSTLGSHMFLRNLSERHRMLLASGMKPFKAAPEEVFAREGAAATAFYLIQSGQVSLGTHTPDRARRAIQTVGPGEIVGWSWLVPPHRWQFECQALTPVQGIVFDAEWLREKCEQDHELGYHLLKELLAVIAGRLAATRLQLPGPQK